MQGVFFDLDGTLLSEEATKGLSRRFFQQFCSSLAGISERTFFIVFRKVNQSLYEKLIQGHISGRELLSQRFQKTLEELEISDGKNLARKMEQAWDELYYSHYSLDDQALPVLKALKNRNLTLAIITNGLVDIQIKKIKKFPALHKLLEVIIISEEYGINKPDPRIFQICLEKTNIVNPKNALFVGNNLESDIEGAENAGIRAILFDPLDNYPIYSGEKIKSLSEILLLI
ncbi:MAG: HAD family hydrolase [Candidatus Hermodarchaeota archaeon]